MTTEKLCKWALLASPVNDFVVDFAGRSDWGIKLLSLQQAASLARPEPAGPGATFAAQGTLREAVSFLVSHGIAQVNLVNSAGAHAGVLYAQDIFSHG